MRAVYLIMERLSFSPSIQNDRWGAIFYYKREAYIVYYEEAYLWGFDEHLPSSLPLMNPRGPLDLDVGFVPRPSVNKRTYELVWYVRICKKKLSQASNLV